MATCVWNLQQNFYKDHHIHDVTMIDVIWEMARTLIGSFLRNNLCFKHLFLHNHPFMWAVLSLHNGLKYINYRIKKFHTCETRRNTKFTRPRQFSIITNHQWVVYCIKKRQHYHYSRTDNTYGNCSCQQKKILLLRDMNRIWFW